MPLCGRTEELNSSPSAGLRDALNGGSREDRAGGARQCEARGHFGYVGFYSYSLLETDGLFQVSELETTIADWDMSLTGHT